ncbi:hypothetical protein B9Z55_022327 [Caenorhabditis nigoni]|uniref:Uncharacterized protein n=1 Tax=Caenorhabditis nigoni TaxID=1611254 RepID=A0A2G5SJR5_9PELO|nr:hypothetical protein B9Z55_022327 [Caenorhabditis nigoni]
MAKCDENEKNSEEKAALLEWSLALLVSNEPCNRKVTCADENFAKPKRITAVKQSDDSNLQKEGIRSE